MDAGVASDVGSYREKPIRSIASILDGEISGSDHGSAWGGA